MSDAKQARQVLVKHGPELLELACKMALGKMPLEEYAQSGCLPPNEKLLMALVRQLPRADLQDDAPPPVVAGARSPEERVEAVMAECLAGRMHLVQAQQIVNLITSALDAQEASRLLRMFNTLREPHQQHPGGFF